MTGTIFVNYRREDSIGTAGRLYDRLEQAFGRKNLFVDVVGADLKARLNTQIAVCQAFVAVISPNWLGAKDETGQRLLHNPDDFIAVEIAAALNRKIHVVPVLVDGAHRPRASELPESLKPLARRQAVEVDQNYFDEDVETLIETVREALKGGSVGQRSRRRAAMAWVAAAAGLLLIGWTGLHWIGNSVWPPRAETREAGNAKAQAQADAKRKSEEAGQQRLATVAADAEAKRKREEAEQQRQATLSVAADAEAEAKRKSEEAEQQRLATLSVAANAEAEAKRKSEEAEQQRVAALRAEEEEHNRAEAEARARYSALISQGTADFNARDYDRAIANYNEAVRLDPKSANAFRGRGKAYRDKGDHSRAIADFNEAIRLDPKSALAFMDRGDSYTNKGDNDRAIADYNEAIRTRSQEFARSQRPGRRLCKQRRHRPSHHRF